MTDRLVYVSRLVHLPLIGADGAEVGRIVDVALGHPSPGEAPSVHGFVVEVQRRRVFVGANRVAELGLDGARLRRGSINMRQFELQPGELLVVGNIFDRRVRDQWVVDVAIHPASGADYAWDVATVALGGGLFSRRRTRKIVEWSDVPELFAGERPVDRQAATITGLHPVEMAATIRALPPGRRRALAAALEDERLADLLEEMPEDEQMRIVEGLDLERAARVLDEMDADDAADLLAEMTTARRDQLLGAMDPDEADPVRRLLGYEADTAGGLMTPEPVIMSGTATVAEALARIREPELPAALGAQVFVASPPLETPTGRYLGLVGYQRLLREVPTKPLSRCLDEHPEALAADAPARDVAARLAAYDTVAIPVIDPTGRLVGAVTVDDVLDHVLPDDWRGR